MYSLAGFFFLGGLGGGILKPLKIVTDFRKNSNFGWASLGHPPRFVSGNVGIY
jgi:hypothetical protein